MHKLLLAASIVFAGQIATGGITPADAKPKHGFKDTKIEFIDTRGVDCDELKGFLKANFYLKTDRGGEKILAGDSYNCRILNSNEYAAFEAHGTGVATRSGKCRVWHCRGLTDRELNQR